MMPRSDKRAFTDVFEDETGGNVKTLQSDYLPSGEYPIVDQGKDLIGGFTDDPTRLCKSRLPVIVFGDHTKCLKYVDFPFCLGADGTKILRPRIQANAKYLYYFLRTVYIPEAGYSRHFKYLKQSEIPLPPLKEQKRIAGILDQADSLRRLRQRAIDRLNTLGQAIFYEMFGDPRAPKGDIEVKQVGDVVSRLTNGYVGPTRDIYRENGIPYLLAKHVKNQAVTFDGQTFVDDIFNMKHSKSILRAGDVLLVQSGHIGSSAVVPNKHHGHNCHAMIVITPRAEYLTGDYLSGAFSTDAMQAAFRSIQTGQTLPHLNCKDVKKLPIAIPSLQSQEEFSRRLSEVGLAKTRLEKSIEISQCLFSSLQHRAFRGEL
jgi:type I restriction enzyme, S subunit